MDQFLHPLDVQEGVVAVGLAARDGLALFIPAFAQAWPIEEAAQFNALLHEIDAAECETTRSSAGDFR
jgi:hypothetical protein